MPRKIAILLCMLALCGLSCTEFSCLDLVRSASGDATYLDRTAQAKLHLRIEEWNENGTFPTGYDDLDTTGYLKEWRFKYSRLYIMFDGNKAHPVTSRSVLEAIAIEWYELYPENRKPRFTLVVRAFKDTESSNTEWGFCKILKDGRAEIHWYATDVY